MSASHELAAKLVELNASSKYHEPNRDLDDVYGRLKTMVELNDPDMRPVYPVMLDMIIVLLNRIGELEHAADDANTHDWVYVGDDLRENHGVQHGQMAHIDHEVVEHVFQINGLGHLTPNKHNVLGTTKTFDSIAVLRVYYIDEGNNAHSATFVKPRV